MRVRTSIISVGLFGLIFGSVVDSEAASTRIKIPMDCSQGPKRQYHKGAVTVPPVAAQGSRYKVRIDGTNSGKISHVGLNHIFNMAYEWAVPPGTQFVSSSARVLPGTGTANVRKGATVGHKAGVIKLLLPARLESGSNYTPPSIEFELQVNAAPGTTIAQLFKRYRVTANAFLVGDVDTTCDAVPKPYPVAGTKVTPAQAPPPVPAKPE